MSELLRIGEWEADPARCVVRRDDAAPVKLTPRAMNVLVHLSEQPGEVVSVEALIAKHWPHTVTSPNAVHKVVSELRHALGDVVETVPKRGYRLVPAVERVANGSAFVEGVRAPTSTRTGPRKQVVFAIVVLVAVAAAVGLVYSDFSRVSVVTWKDRSAVLLPVRRADHKIERQILETARDKATAKLVVLDGASVQERTLPRWLVTAYARDVDYEVEIDVVESQGRLHATLAIVPESRELPTHREQLDESATDPVALSEALAVHVADDLAVLLDDKQVATMRAWGTLNVHAYRLEHEANTFQRMQSPEPLARAAELHRRAIREDSRFKNAYLGLSGIYSALLVTPKDTADREQLRQSMQELAREAKAASLDADTQGLLERLAREFSAGTPYETEEQWRMEIVRNPKSVEAFNRYSRLLEGAKLFVEGRQYLQRCIELARESGQLSWVAGSERNYATYAEAEGNFEEAVRINRRTLVLYPEDTAPLFGLVRALSKLARYAEAESYLARLERTNETWGHGASVVLRTHRGEISPGSAAMEEAFAHPMTSNAMRGGVCFVQGDVECGVRWWRQMEPGLLPIYWEFGPGNEVYFAPGVLTDPRYRELVNDLGFGPRWRQYMREKAAELTPITGIEITSPPPPEDLAAGA